MRRLTISLLATGLLGASGAPAIAQEPSPDPPPWFGGRVEMPGHGFAITIPDGWVAVDLSGDITKQAALLASRAYQELEACSTTACAAMLQEMTLKQTESDFLVPLLEAQGSSTLWFGNLLWFAIATLSTGDSARIEECRLGKELWIEPLRPDDLTELVDDVVEGFDADPQLEVVGEPREAIVGGHVVPSFDFEDSGMGPDSDLAPRGTWYLLAGGEDSYRNLLCRGEDWPEDRWFSIAETYEIMPAAE